MLSLELIKQQLRLEIDYVGEDDLLMLYSAAALRLIESHTRRTLVQESEADIDPELNLVFSGDVRLAALLIIGHWYANRESVVVGASGAQLPLGFDALLQPYVRYGIEQLLQQGAALRAQLEETEGLTASERKLASFEQELIGLQGQHLNARQKTIQAHSSEIRAQLIKNAELEKEIKYKELRKKFDDQNFEVMQRTSKLSQDSSNQMLQMTMSQPAYDLMLEEQKVRDDFRQRRYQLDKEVSDKTTQLYSEQTLFLSQEEQRQLDIVRQSSRDKLAMNRNATTGMAKGIQDFGNSAENVYDQMRSISNGALSDMSGMLANFVATGKLNFADFAQSIVTEITKMIFQMMIFNALKAGFAGTAFGDAIGAGAAPTPNAKGGVYDSPSLGSFSNQVVSSPTLFAFAKGGAPNLGLMGEGADPEAIMPLTRGRDGSLGVRVLGLDTQQQTPNIIIQQTFHLTGNGDQALQEAIQQAAEMGAKQGSLDALTKIQRDFQNNGTLRKSLGR